MQYYVTPLCWLAKSMKKITAHNLSWNNDHDIKIAQTFLENDTIGLSTTDTIPGLLASLTEKSYKALCTLKGDRLGKPFLILIGDPEKSKHFVASKSFTENAQKIITHFWPGPLTIIFRAKTALPSFMQSDIKTIALRCPDHKGLQKLLAHFDGLFSTSANKSVYTPPSHLGDVHRDLLETVAFVIDSLEPSKKKTLPRLQPSTIIDCTTSTPHLIREGLIPFSEIKTYYEKNK